MAARKRVSPKPSAAPEGAESDASPSDAACSPSAGIAPAFGAHLERIRAAKGRADVLVDSEISLEAPEASLALLWEIVFDRLCAAGDADVSEVGTLAGIVQKLFSADSRRSAGKPCRAEGAGISAQTLRKIEEKLKLL